MNFFTINSDIDRPERRGHGAKVPASEMARERKGQGASWPGNESARVLLADSLRRANWPGSEKARYPSICIMSAIRNVPFRLSERLSVLDLDAMVLRLRIKDSKSLNQSTQPNISTQFLFTVTSLRTPEKSRDPINKQLRYVETGNCGSL